ncbi:MAG: type transport system ATP-binding protein [Thermoplasmata archaeon]|jgi:ABC-2 type transport system ATP-binding protein|nr:type transport system ATP-binding protein [Thermoplasmata archaeon]
MRRLLPLLLCLLLAVPAVAAQGSGSGGPAWKRTDFDFPSFDGTVLKASSWIPTGGCPCPAIVETNGWNNRHDQASELRFAERYAGQGYYVLGFTSRGWGNSGGDIELDGPKEQNDTKAVIDYLAKQPEVRQDGPGDPRVGMIGESYAGGIQLLVAQQDRRIDALLPLITWNNLLVSLAPHDVMKIGWVTELFATGQTVGRGAPVPGQHPGDPNPSGPSQKLTQWYAESAAANGPTAEMRTEIGEVRSLHRGALMVPTLLMQGWGDTLFQPNEALTTYLDLKERGVPVRLAYFPGGHGISLAQDDPAFVAADAVRDDWFNVTLRGQAPALPPYPVLRYRYAEKDYVGETQWPPAGTAVWRGYLGPSGLDAKTPDAAATVQLLNPVGPSTCADVPSFQSQTGSVCPRTTPQTSTVLTGPPLEADIEVTGTPVAHLQVSSTQPTDVRLFLTLADVDAAGASTPILKQTMPVRLAGGAPTAVDVAMQTVTATLAKGHRIGLQVATTDLGFFASREPGAVTLSSSPDAASWLDVPVVPKDAWGDRVAPAITLQPVASVGAPCGEATACPDCAQTPSCAPARLSYTVAVTVADNVGLPATFLAAASQAGPLQPTFGSRATTVGTAVLRLEMPTDPAAEPARAEVTATDLLGNKATTVWTPPADWATTGCSMGVASLCPPAPAKKSPGLEFAFVLAAVAVGLALRRRL